MKIIIVSDTHGNIKNFQKVVEFANKENVGVILHAGDIGDPDFLRESLAGYDGKLFGVLGNMDKDFKILLSEYNKIPNVKIEEEVLLTNSHELVNDNNIKTIAITHKPEKARELAESGKFDLVLYGHTHKPWLDSLKLTSESGEEKVCKLINPGELAGQFFKPTFAVYDTEKDFLELKILENLNI